MNIQCDNYSSCGSQILDRGGVKVTVDYARAKGWHLYKGPSITGKDLDVVLCDRCVGTNRKMMVRLDHLDGQAELEW